MLKIFLPDQHVKDIFEITPESLKEKAIKGVITDLDNTLVAWNEPHATEKIKVWLKSMEDSGIKVTIVSNNDKKRVKLFSSPLNRPYVYRANKPLRRAFLKSSKKMGLKKEEVVVIGDQIMTDIWGGNRSGFHTILVVPILQSDDKATKLNRKLERFILRKLEKRGWMKWQG